MKKLIAITLLGLSVVSGAAEKRQLSAYEGYQPGNPIYTPDKWEALLFVPMEKAGFNTIELKVQPYQVRRLDVFKYEKELTVLVNLATKHGLEFQVYLYPAPYSGDRRIDWEEHKKLPALVTENGREYPGRFSLIDYEVWREAFAHAFDFAKLSLKIPITAVKLDIETIANCGMSYDDKAWQKFCMTNPDFHAGTSADKRFAALKDANAVDKYRKWFIGEFENTVIKFEKEMHAINPKLKLGLMPTCYEWVSDGFIKYLGTQDAPAIIDDWCMYNGEGYSDEVKKRRDKIKQKNPNNLFIPWFRINSYHAEDIPAQAYHAAINCDGYSNWTLTMLCSENQSGVYELPAKYTSDDYWNAYRKANDAISLDIKENTLKTGYRIPFTPPKPLVMPIDYSVVTIPDLIPAGSGSDASAQKKFTLRGQQTIFIHADAGEDIKVTLKHEAGRSRPTALLYALIDKNRNKLRNEMIPPGVSETFTVVAPGNGIYALAISGRDAWYSVTVYNKHYAFDARRRTDFFGAPLRVFVAGTDFGNPSLAIHSRSGQVYMYNKNLVVSKEKHPVLLKTGFNELIFEKPEKPIEGYYTQDFSLSLPEGKIPYIFASPELRLVPR
ncbi:MAG: hypothetical protein WCI51_06080 [Lentisphaerota bacterium]